MLREELEMNGVSWKGIWQQVQEIVIKSLLAC
jgi:hypothetical protein